MRGGHLLVTGFGPFPGVPVNPSGALAREIGALGRRRIAGARVRVLVLDTAYEAIQRTLEPALADGPAAVLMIGVAIRAGRVRVEARARNRASRLFPDASGCRAASLHLDTSGPAERRAALADRALVCLRRHGVPARASRDAGRYLCNASYFRALAEPCPVLFLHIPPARGPWRRCEEPPLLRRTPSRSLAAAVAEVGRLLLVAARTARRS